MCNYIHTTCTRCGQIMVTKIDRCASRPEGKILPHSGTRENTSYQSNTRCAACCDKDSGYQSSTSSSSSSSSSFSSFSSSQIGWGKFHILISLFASITSCIYSNRHWNVPRSHTLYLFGRTDWSDFLQKANRRGCRSTSRFILLKINQAWGSGMPEKRV